MTHWPADPRTTRRFHFGACVFDPSSGLARLHYRLDNHPDLVETIRFPYAPWPPEASRQAAFQQALRILHLIAGVSYYKAVLAPDITFEDDAPPPLLAGFIHRVYINGLAEFAWVNRVDVAQRFSFQAGQELPQPARDLLLPDRALVAMGGGKDSLVGLQLLQSGGLEVQPACIGSSPLIAATVAAAGLPLLRIERQLAEQLPAINAAGAWNGHVPVTAINSAILVCAAILYGYRYVVFANERSADEPTLVDDNGRAVNHQYSKSSSFERDFRQVIAATVSPDVCYFSILRPFSELDIVRRFSQMSRYHAAYSSCNRNFHLEGSSISGRWCGDCPKCRFAALSLAVFMRPDEVVAIMGKDLLADAAQADGFRALCGLGRDKPFECVGEAGESRAAMLALAQHADWRDHAVVRALQPELAGVDVPDLQSLLVPAATHCIPAELLARLPEGLLMDGRQ